MPKISAKFKGAPNKGGLGYNRQLLTNTSRYMSETVKDRDIVTM